MSEILPRWNAPEYIPIVVDIQKLKAEFIENLETYLGRSLSDSDPVRAIGLVCLDRIIQSLEAENVANQQQFLPYAIGDALNAHAHVYNLTRLPASAAVTDIEFTLSTTLQNAYLIPQGTEITNGIIVFETTETLVIEPNKLSGTVRAKCQTAGTVGNNYLPGQINILVNPLPYVQIAANISTTIGGSEEESDEAYAERLHAVLNSITTAGPVVSYKFWAKTVSSAIQDVQIFTPEPGIVQVYIILQNGELPNQTLCDLVYDTLSSDEIRPLGDKVEVLAPQVIPYNIKVNYFIDLSNKPQALTIQERINEALKNFILWQKAVIGRDIVPDELTAALVKAGAKRVEIIEPSFKVLNNGQIAQEKNVELTFVGFEEG